MIYSLQDIAGVRDADAQGKRLYNTIFVLAEEDVDYSHLPTITESETVRSMAALTLKENAGGWKKFTFAKYTTEATSDGSAGEITSTNTNKLTGTLGGDRVEIDNLLQQIGGAYFVVVIDRFTMKKMIYGRPYSPMYFTEHAKRKNKDNTSADITFTQESFFQPLEYLGDIDSAPSGSE